jgi:6-phosphogluconolactonase (cycloisomerase 2 family)
MSNPAFLRVHPTEYILYACSESIKEDDKVVAFTVSPATGQMRPLVEQSTIGKSCCYLTLDKSLKHLLFVNYWDSTVGAFPLERSGMVGPLASMFRPVKGVQAGHRQDHLNNRQSEPHAHAIVLDPYQGRVAFIPDLGEDVVKQFLYDCNTGKLFPTGSIPADVTGRKGPYGPRYIEFHPRLPLVFLVNELSSSISVFEFDRAESNLLIQQGSDAKNFRQTLIQVQSISTIPHAFPKQLNTCGRITVDPTGNFVVVSNRGHNSIAIFRINEETRNLTEVGYFHTRGRTPRHFQFDKTGQFLIVANQDTDSIAVFLFDQKTGSLTFTGYSYDIPSPNFVCFYPLHKGHFAKL